MSNWFLLYDKQPLPAALNMARDEYLFELCQRTKAGFLRLYSWDKPSFSFGVSQKISRAVDADFISQSNLAYVRRITGGKTVMHDHEVTYSVISSEDIFYKDNDLYRSYMLIANVLVDALRRLDLNAVLSQGSASHLSKSSNPCFSFPTPNEIEVEGKKIIGSAQKRNERALLQHGSIPLSMNYELYAAGTRSRPAIIQRSMTTLGDVSQKTGDDLCRAMIDAFGAFVGRPLADFAFDVKDEQAIVEIEKKYLSDHWNSRL